MKEKPWTWREGIMKAIMTGAMMALTVTAAGAAETDAQSASSMLPDCKAAIDGDRSGNGFARGFCVGTVLALAFMAQNSGVNVTAFSGEGQNRWFDERWQGVKIPESVTQGQIVEIVVLYIEARPERMREPFRSLALEALFNTWPYRPAGLPD
jgi:Rap1a immunity proteins